MVFLGWVLGMVSIWITEGVKNWKNRVETDRAIQTELNELRLKLLCSIYLLRMRLGTFDRNLLNWMVPLIERYQGSHVPDPIVARLQDLAALDDARIQDAVTVHAQSTSQQGLTLKKYTVPYLEAKMSQLGTFSEPKQSALFSIKAHMDLLNQEIEAARRYADKTFDSTITTDNHAKILNNVMTRYQYAAEGAETVVHLINKLDQIRNREWV